jgi:hypothetical protein
MLPRNSTVHWRSFRRLLRATHSSRPGARTRFCRRRAKSDDDVLPVHETVGNALLHCNTMWPTNAPCRPRIGTSSNKTIAARRNQETGRHATAHSRQVTLGSRRTLGASAVLIAGTTPHTRTADLAQAE